MTYRNGAVGALMDEYERAAEELKRVLDGISTETFLRVADPDTEDPDCRSIQTVMNHVVRAGYGYANYLRISFGDTWTERRDDYGLASPAAARSALDQMLAYTLETMENKWDLSFEQCMAHQIQSRWGQVYDFEQLVEHAIVHVLRHRRQIEKFIVQLA